MGIKKILWLEDQYEDLSDYLNTLFRADYLVDPVESVSEAVKKLRKEDYMAVIFDIKVLPGDDNEWKELNKRKKDENPYFDPYLGLELLYSLFNSPKARVKLEPPIQIDPERVIIFSAVYDIVEELSALGIPADQIIYKSYGDLATLPGLMRKIERKIENEK
jgi:hypothetical protein